MICKLNIKPPVMICLQTCSEYSEHAASIWIEKGTQSTDRNMALSYTVSCQLSIIMKGAAIYKIFKIPKLILRCVLVLMLGCEKCWLPWSTEVIKWELPCPFPLLLKGKTRITCYFPKSFKYNWSLILVHSSSGEESRKEGWYNCVSLLQKAELFQ